MCLCALECKTHRDQKRASDPLGARVTDYAVRDPTWGLGTKLWSSERTSGVLHQRP